MHALMAVLLRMTRFDALDANSQPEPPPASLLKLKKAWAEAKGVAASLKLPIHEAA